jgi:hypothetical protein
VSKKSWLIIALVAALFVGLLIYGIHTGDVEFVLKNARDFCFS